MTDTRTIAAISTPVGVGGIAVIRLSGSLAVDIADRVYRGRKKLADVETHTVNYGFIKDADENTVDEVLVTVMRAPRSYTKEDVVEISTHGGLVASKNVLKCLITAGAYPAEPGEFTKRAFLNGRIDLSQAEAIIDVLNSKTSLAQQNAMSQMSGGLSKQIDLARAELISLAASMQVIIDYPDEELEDVTGDDIYERTNVVKNKIEEMIASSENGKIIKDGIRAVISGKPNVGKSSLLNFLAREERAIVTDIAGTTRDIIEETVNLDGVPLILTDTAGIRQTDDAVEKIGVERSLKSVSGADLNIVVLDASTEPDDEEIKLIEDTEGKKRIIIINKSDIRSDGAVKKVRQMLADEPIEISVKNGDGVEALVSRIKEMYKLGEIGKNENSIITNVRHLSALQRAKEALENVLDAISCGMPSDIASIDLNIAIESLGEITGASVSEDIVSAIFHDFCVGK